MASGFLVAGYVILSGMVGGKLGGHDGSETFLDVTATMAR
jgi:hypothetical protein